MVEQAAVNRKVEGSSPSLGAKFFSHSFIKNPDLSGEPHAEAGADNALPEPACFLFSAQKPADKKKRSRYFRDLNLLYHLKSVMSAGM